MQAFAGIVTVSVGHCHPGVVSAVQQQLHKLMHTTTIYLHPEIAQYAKELTDRLPGNLKASSAAFTGWPGVEHAACCGVRSLHAGMLHQYGAGHTHSRGGLRLQVLWCA